MAYLHSKIFFHIDYFLVIGILLLMFYGRIGRYTHYHKICSKYGGRRYSLFNKDIREYLTYFPFIVRNHTQILKQTESSIEEYADYKNITRTFSFSYFFVEVIQMRRHTNIGSPFILSGYSHLLSIYICKWICTLVTIVISFFLIFYWS